MGQTPAKMFQSPTPFGTSPVSTVSQAQPVAQVTGPGFAPAAAYDQTQQQDPSQSQPQNSLAQFSQQMGGSPYGGLQGLFGANVARGNLMQ